MASITKAALTAGLRRSIQVGARVATRTARTLTSRRALKAAVIRAAAAAKRVARSPGGQALIWGSVGTIATHYLMPDRASAEGEIWDAIDNITEAIRHQQNYTNEATSEWQDRMEHQQMLQLAGESDKVAEELLNNAAASVRRTRSQINGLLEGRLRLDLLPPQEWERMWAVLAQHAADSGMRLLAESTADVAHMRPEVKRHADGMLSVRINVPAAHHEDVMSLLEFIPVPLHALHNETVATFFNPPHPFIALSEPDADERVTTFRTLTLAERTACYRLNDITVCENARPARHRTNRLLMSLEERCALALFSADAPDIALTCPATTGANVDALIPMDGSTVVAVAAAPDKVRITCHRQRTSTYADIPPGSTQIDVLPGCSAMSRAGAFHASDHHPETRAVKVEPVDWSVALRTALAERAVALASHGFRRLPLLQTNLSSIEAAIAARRSPSGKGFFSGFDFGNFLHVMLMASIAFACAALVVCAAGWVYFGCRCRRSYNLVSAAAADHPAGLDDADPDAVPLADSPIIKASPPSPSPSSRSTRSTASRKTSRRIIFGPV
jgi:hypothetical protein